MESECKWFVLRDLKRANAKEPAYLKLSQLGFDVFTPLTTNVTETAGRRVRREVPVIQDLLFVRTDRETLDPVIARTDTLQYRYLKGQTYGTPMTVPAWDMDRFIAAVSHLKAPRYYRPEEITPAMCGARIRMVCQGTLDGMEGRLLRIKGSGEKRLLVELPGLLAASVEITSADYIELI